MGYTDERFGGILPSIAQVIVNILFSILIFRTAKFIWEMKRLYYYSRKVHGPAGLPILGIAHIFIGKEIYEIIDKFMHMFDAYPKLGNMWFGPTLLYFTSESEYVKKVLTSQSCIGKKFVYELFAERFIGFGLLTAPEKQWKAHRKVLNMSFRQKTLDSYVKIFSKKAIMFSQKLEENIGKKSVDFTKLVSAYTLDTLCETVMGIKMNFQNGQCDFGENFDRMAAIIGQSLPRFWFYIDFVYRFSSAGQELPNCIKKIKDFVNKVIEEKLQRITIETAENREECLSAAVEESRNGSSLLEWMLQNSNFRQEEINDEVCVFMIAGTDTTAVTLANIFAMLGMHQDIQQKVYEEVVDIFGIDGEVTHSDLNKMGYTDRVIKEALRLFPVIPILNREVKEDLILGESVVPAGASIVICPLHIHRNPKFWPDPLIFDPDRFLPENVKKRHSGTYIPFSIGSRNCIGGRYGMMNMRTAVAVMIRKLKFFTEYKSVEEIKLTFNILLKLSDGPKIWVEKRR